MITEWKGFVEYALGQFHNDAHFKYQYNFNTKTCKLAVNYHSYFRSQYLAIDLNNYFFKGDVVLQEENTNRVKLPTIEKFLERKFLNLAQIHRIKQMINPINWYDESTINLIAENEAMEIRSVRQAISLITSKEIGFYFADDLTSMNVVEVSMKL